MNLIQQIALFTVGLLFLIAGVLKYFSLRDFRTTLYLIPYLPVVLVPIVVLAVPIFEITIGLGLLLNYSLAKWLSVLILTLFCGLTLIVLRKGLKISCNCFGAQSGETLSVKTIIRNLLLIGLIGFSWRTENIANPFLPLLTAATFIFIIASILQIIETMQQFKQNFLAKGS